MIQYGHQLDELFTNMTPEQYAFEYSQLLNSSSMLSKTEVQRKQAIERIAEANPIINEAIVKIEMDLLMSIADENDDEEKLIHTGSLPDIVAKLEHDYSIVNQYSITEIERTRRSLEDLL